MPQISVIIPVYKVEAYLRRCVDSILAQTFQDFELILVDDGSPDNCPAICDEYAAKDSRIRVIHQANGGLSAARNTGIDAAAAEYFLFCDSDDVLHPECLQILLSCIQKTGAKIALGEFDRFHEVAVTRDCFSAWDGTYMIKSNVETLNCLFDGRESLHSLVSSCGKLFRRDLFTDIRFPVGRLFEDEFTTYQLYYRAERIAFTGITLYYYFVNPNGITGTLSIQKRFDEYDAQWERMMFFQHMGLVDLLGKAAVSFLKTAQWDLIACRKGQEAVDPNRMAAFEKQYRDSFTIAKKRGMLSFLRDFDYYLLAYPQRCLFFRAKRKLLLLFGRKG